MIRIAKKEDKERIYEMCLAFKEYSPYADFNTSEEQIRNAIDFLLNSTLIAEDEEGNVVGLITGIINYTLFSPDKICYEVLWWVEPEHRNKSYGQDLHTALEKWATEQGAKKIAMVLLEGKKYSTVIDQMYRSMGYSPVETSYFKDVA